MSKSIALMAALMFIAMPNNTNAEELGKLYRGMLTFCFSEAEMKAAVQDDVLWDKYVREQRCTSMQAEYSYIRVLETVDNNGVLGYIVEARIHAHEQWFLVYVAMHDKPGSDDNVPAL